LKDLQADINAAIKLENKLKDEKFIDEIKTVLKIAKIGFIDAAGNALHRLHETKPTIDAVKELIQGFPDALSFKNEKNRLPVQSALWRNSAATKYVPILAKEGIKHEVGGRGMRGGLLHADPRDSTDHCNTLQMLSSVANMGDADDPIPDDTARHEVMKKLRKGNLLLKQDIRDQHLLYWSCHLDCKMRFSFFAEWDPDCLMTGTYGGLPLSHATIKHWPNLTSSFIMYDTSRLPSSIIATSRIALPEGRQRKDSIRKIRRETWKRGNIQSHSTMHPFQYLLIANPSSCHKRRTTAHQRLLHSISISLAPP